MREPQFAIMLKHTGHGLPLPPNLGPAFYQPAASAVNSRAIAYA